MTPNITEHREREPDHVEIVPINLPDIDVTAIERRLRAAGDTQPQWGCCSKTCDLRSG